MPYCHNFALPSEQSPHVVGWELNVNAHDCYAGLSTAHGSSLCPGVPDGSAWSSLSFREPALFEADVKEVVGPASSGDLYSTSTASCPPGYLRRSCTCSDTPCQGVRPSSSAPATECLAQRTYSGPLIRASVTCVRPVASDVPVRMSDVWLSQAGSGESVACPAGTSLVSCSCLGSSSCGDGSAALADYHANTCTAPPLPSSYSAVKLAATCVERDYCAALSPCNGHPCINDPTAVKGYVCHCTATAGGRFTDECGEVLSCPG